MTTERSGSAAERSAAARLRVEELRRLSARLQAGERVDEADVELARTRAQEAQDRSRTAHMRAAAAHEQAAGTHRIAAMLAENSGQPGLADEHRRAALSDDDLAVDDARAGRGSDGQEPTVVSEAESGKR